MANEKRLIDLDLAIERAKESDKIVKSSIWETCEVVEFLEDCPIEDAVEVVHGRWKYHDPVSPNCFCSVCYHDAPWDDFGDYHSDRTNYCPNCGAKMDGDGNG